MIPIYLTPASAATVLTIDDPSVDQDAGADFTAELVTASRAVPAGAWTEFRWHSQHAFITTSATFKFTPSVDSLVNDMDEITSTKSAGFTGEQLIEFPAFKFGTRLRSRMRVTSHVGLCELGGHELVFIPRRRQRSYAP